MSSDRPHRYRASVDGFLDATRKTLHVATFRASQYRRMMQKKVDLAALQRKITAAHADLGRFVDDCREQGESGILVREEVQAVFRRLDEYKSAAALLEAELDSIRKEMPAAEQAPPE